MHYYTCMSPLIQDGIITTVNTKVSVLPDAYDSRDVCKVTLPINTKTYEGSMTSTENTGEIPKLFLSIL